MAISSASTFTEVEAEYLDTSQYVQQRSSFLAYRHAIAVRYLLLLIPSTTTKGSNSVSYSTSVLERELKRAEQYAVQFDVSSAGGIVRVDFRNMRTYG